MAEIKWKIVQTFGVLSERSGWTRELSLVSWNEREPKFDIRDWSPDKSKMGKGITLTLEEITALKELLAEIE